MGAKVPFNCTTLVRDKKKHHLINKLIKPFRSERFREMLLSSKTRAITRSPSSFHWRMAMLTCTSEIFDKMMIMNLHNTTALASRIHFPKAYKRRCYSHTSTII